MEGITLETNKLRFLLCRDIDNPSSTRIAEKFVPISPCFDGVLLCGPFYDGLVSTAESRAVAEADIASVIAQFENVVCRVLYLPSETDPNSCLTEQLHLTPNSVNMHGRQLNLASRLYAMGFTERSNNTKEGKVPASVDRSEASDDELEDVSVQAGLSVSIVQEMLEARSMQNTAELAAGIFVLNYSFAHTLSQVLFHMPGLLESSGLDLLIVSSDSEEAGRLPAKLGKLSIASLKSLRCGGHYTVVELERENSEAAWHTSSVRTHNLDDKIDFSAN